MYTEETLIIVIASLEQYNQLSYMKMDSKQTVQDFSFFFNQQSKILVIQQFVFVRIYQKYLITSYQYNFIIILSTPFFLELF